MNLLLCDDEKAIVEQMKSFSKGIEDIPLTLFVANTSEDAVKLMEEHRMDAAIFDIDIDETSGIELAKQYKKHNPVGTLAFLTSYDSYAYDAFQVEAVKYLLKPVTEASFKETVTFLYQRYVEKSFIENHMSKSVAIKYEGQQILIKQAEIVYIEKIGKKSIYHTLLDSYEVRETIKAIYEQLSSDMFLQCHQGFIINVDYIQKLERYTVYIGMGDESIPVPVSKANVERVKEAIRKKIWGE